MFYVVLLRTAYKYIMLLIVIYKGDQRRFTTNLKTLSSLSFLNNVTEGMVEEEGTYN